MDQHLRRIFFWPIRRISIGRFQLCVSFDFFQIGHLPFTRISFFDTCQKTVYIRRIFLWPIGRAPSADSNPVYLLVSSKSAIFPSQESPSLTRVKKQCQHMPPSFGIIYFVPKLLQPAFKAIPRTLCTRLTPYNWIKLFFAPGLSPSICTTQRADSPFVLSLTQIGP